MIRAIRFDQAGGPDVMHMVEIELTPPKAGELRVRHSAIGLNFIDTYHRSGLYPLPLPTGLGLEASGVVEGVGEGVKDFGIGDRVAYGTGPRGAYADAANVPAARVTKLPSEISDETAAGMMLKGLTVRFLLRETYKVKAGETILVHAAAGGVGLILCQWAKALGAIVIGTVGSAAKADLARANGCTHVINNRSEDVPAKVKEITDGKGVPVVYDGVGQATLMMSLDSLQPRGLLVNFGNAGGPVKSLDLGLLAAKGSLYVTRPTLFTYVADDRDLAASSRDLVDVVASGKVKIPVNQRYALKDVAKAHHDLENGLTTGTTIFIP
ncbi:quinone oxidoreductase [soil metagenome]